MLQHLSIRSKRTGKPVQGGIGLESLSSTKVSASLLHRPYVTVRLVSMVDGGLFDKLDEIGRKIRGKPYTPFGGIQARIGLYTCSTFRLMRTGRLSSLGISFNCPLLAKEANQCALLSKLLLGSRRSKEPSSLRKSFGKRMRVRTRFHRPVVRLVKGI
jgi:hypothetical protein